MTESAPLRGLKIGLLTDWMSYRGGGIPPIVLAQAELIAAQGGEPAIFALADPNSSAEPDHHGTVPITLSQVRGTDRFGFSPGLLRELLGAELDLLHFHGGWLYPSRAALRWARITRRPYVMSCHGMLSPWLMARGRVQKAIARRAYLDANLREANVLHALTASEAADYLNEAGRDDALIIPNPGPDLMPAPGSMPAANVVFIGRFHEKKNLLALIDGWRQTSRPADAKLVIAGFGSAAEAALLAVASAAVPGIELRGGVFGAEKAELIASARFVILPSHSEGLPVAILEAWSAGTPAIMTPACNLPEGFAAGAALECGTDPAQIASALNRALTIDEPAWLAMSSAAQRLAAGPFSAGAVAQRWIEAYRTALASQPRR